MNTGTLYIISAPSGAGKTSLVRAVTDSMSDVMVSISYTTRMQRPGEKDGVNYHFVDKALFEEYLKKDIFLEHAKVFGNYYGTSHQWVKEKLVAGIDVILEIDWQGAQQIRARMKNTVSVFILPPSQEVLLKRLHERAQDQEAVIRERMAQAHKEISHYSEYDYLVINDDFATAVADLEAIITARRLLLSLQKEKNADLLANLLAASA